MCTAIGGHDAVRNPTTPQIDVDIACLGSRCSYTTGFSFQSRVTPEFLSGGDGLDGHQLGQYFARQHPDCDSPQINDWWYGCRDLGTTSSPDGPAMTMISCHLAKRWLHHGQVPPSSHCQ